MGVMPTPAAKSTSGFEFSLTRWNWPLGAPTSKQSLTLIVSCNQQLSLPFFFGCVSDLSDPCRLTVILQNLELGELERL